MAWAMTQAMQGGAIYSAVSIKGTIIGIGSEQLPVAW